MSSKPRFSEQQRSHTYCLHCRHVRVVGIWLHLVHIVIDSFEATPSPASLHGIETIRGIDVDDASGDAVAFTDTSRSAATSTSAPCCGVIFLFLRRCSSVSCRIRRDVSKSQNLYLKAIKISLHLILNRTLC
jgi:hypothetical protein